MKFALLTLAFAAAIPAAFATPVTYNTLESELCFGGPGCNTNTQSTAGVTVTFELIGNSTVNPALVGGTTSGSFGTIVISCTAGGTACGGASLDGLNLYINIEQVNPLPGTGNIPPGVITGMMAGTAGNAVITWPSPADTIINGFKYAIANNPLTLVPVTTNDGRTTIQGKITELAIPEPSTYMLFSAGLLALGLRRKFAKR